MSYETVNPGGAKELLEGEQGWAYVDVRTPEEYAEGHVPGAFNIPIAVLGPGGRMEPNPDFIGVVERHFEPANALVLGCAMGGRSARACELLASRGFARLVNMHGGFSGARDQSGRLVEPGWADCGFPCESAPDPDRSYDALR